VTGGEAPRHPAEPPPSLAAGRVRTVPELAAVLRWLRRRQAWARGAAPLTYRELAAATGWSYGCFSGYFRGTVLPPSDRFDMLIGLLGAGAVERSRLATVRDGVADRRDEPPAPLEPTRPAAELSAALLDAAPTGELLARIERDLRAIGARYTRTGPLSSAGRLMETLAQLDLLAERRLSEALRHDVDLLAGLTHRLLGHAHYDLANSAASYQHGRAALWHADRAGHRALQAHALDLLTGVAYRAAAAGTALRYAQQGLWHVHQNQGDVAAALLVGEARAHAALGDAPRAHRAVRAGERVFDNCEPDEISLAADVLRFNQPTYAFQAADLLLGIPGQEPLAERYARRSIDLHVRGGVPGPASPRYQAASYLTLAQCLVHRRDLTGAVNAIDGMPSLRPVDLIETVVLAARRVVLASGDLRRGTVIVDKLTERIGDVQSCSTVPAPGGAPR
jgi:hypothetical protein